MRSLAVRERALAVNSGVGRFLFAAALLVFAVPALHGQAPLSPSSASEATPAPTQVAPARSVQTPMFEVASVRLSSPGGTGLTSIGEWGRPRFTATNATLQLLIELAFDVADDHIEGLPNWGEEQKYDINAEAEGEKLLTYEEAKPLLQQLLKDRFRLVVHRETKDFQGFGLVVAKDGSKLKASKGDNTQAQMMRGKMQCLNCPLVVLAGLLARVTGRPVAEMTGMKGTYDIQLDYAPEDSTDSSLPSIYTALQEQQGLKLIPQKVPTEVVVVDHADRVPTEN